MTIKKFDSIFRENPVACPVCKGYGGWISILNAYGEGEHAYGGCSQCKGHGYVSKDSPDDKCIHEYKEISAKEARERGIMHYGMCWHVYVCSKCGNIDCTDSSD